MKICLIVPVGVKEEKIRNVLKAIKDRPNCVVAMTLTGYEDVKRDIINGLRIYSEMSGASFHKIEGKPWSLVHVKGLWSLLRKEKPNIIMLVGVSGSRYLYPLLFQVLVHYWRATEGKTKIYLLHGVEGEEVRAEPLVGYIATAVGLGPTQRKIFDIIYGTEEKLSAKDLIERYGFSRVVYKVLNELEEKGLVMVKRGSIERTFPGKLLYELLNEGDVYGP